MVERSKNRRGRPALSEQTVARKIIAERLRTSGRTVRSVASSIGLKGHASLSRFFQGRQRLAFETIVDLCDELGIEGHALEKIARSLIPEKLLNVSDHHSPPPEKERSRIKLTRFFFNYNVPIIYEALKILGQASLEKLQPVVHRRLFLSKEDILTCLNQLEEMALVAKGNDSWCVIDRKKDIVIPSKYSMEFGKRVIEKALVMNQSFINEPTSIRMMRSLLTTVRKTKAKNSIDHLKPLIMNFQDDVFNLQGDDDNAVVSVFVSAVEVATSVM